MKAYLLAFLLGIIASTGSNAAELRPRIDDQQIGASLSGLLFPDTLVKDLASGLDNRVLIRVAVIAKAKPIGGANVTVLIKYDLWEEVFNVRMMIGEVTTYRTDFKQVQDVIVHLSRLQLTKLFPIDSLPQDQGLALQAEILINPVEREKIEKLRKWVAANTVPNGVGRSASVLTSKPNDLFNTIFEQYLQGADIAAPWKLTVISKVFRPRGLREESVAQ